MNFTVSIIIPVYNAEKTLERCLSSVSNAIGPDDEMIVVDDSSTDNSLKIVSHFPCHLIKLTQNSGPSHARNAGAMAAQKKILIFVDSDVVIQAEHVDKIKKYFKENEEVHSLTLNVNLKNQSQGFFTDFKNLYMNYIISQSGKSVNYIYGSCCATRRNAFVRWPEFLRMTEDSLWGYQQKKLGLTINCLEEIQVEHLKIYSFFGLVKNDFLISSYFVQSFLSLKRWNTLYTNEPFGHTSKQQKISVIAASLIFLMTFVNLPIALMLFILWAGLNLPFFQFLSSSRSFSFSLISASWYFFTNLVYASGLVAGMANYVSKPRLIRREMI